MDPPMMKWWMVVAIVITVVGIADAAEPGHPLTIDLLMKNDAHVPAHVLERSKDEVTRIFAGAGLAVCWTETAPRFTVTIVSHVLGYARAGSPVMGMALRRASGSTAQVFFSQVQQFAHAYRINLSTMLAYVIAHEIGHLLLPGNGHSPTGVMQARWDKALVHGAATGSLTFTEAQAARIREAR
jgi:hypothetical protein